MLDLNSAKNRLPVLNASAHLFKRVMASALLVVSFVSVSAYANNSHTSNSISRAEAANPINFKHLSINGRAVNYASQPCPIGKGLISYQNRERGLHPTLGWR